MKVEQASSPKTSKSSAGVIPKGSMFGAKFGFVIPKNKLSGSLVPAFRGANKSGKLDPDTDMKKEQAVRKTKWGPDLTQDAFVRKAKLLAYQTRLDQITQQIETKDMETDVGLDSDMGSPNTKESAHHILDAEELEKLKLERREVIGELLKLNPTYKAPLDYVPLLKEDRVLLPVKDYPGYDFLGLIYGSGRGSLKRLEKETGAKIQVFGNKRDSAEKVEITSDDKKDQDDYDELYALVSADTYDKVDAAVALVELLVTPVSAPRSKLSASEGPILDQSFETPGKVPNAAGSAVQPLVRPSQIFQGQFQYISATPSPSNPTQLLSSQSKPGGSVSAVNSGPQSHAQFPTQPYVSDPHNFGQADPPRFRPVVAPCTIPSQSDISTGLQFSSESKVTPMRMSFMARPLGNTWAEPAPDNPIISQLNHDGSVTSWPRPQAPTLNNNMAGITNPPALGHQNNAFGMAGTTYLPVQGQQNLGFGTAQTVPFHSRPLGSLLPGNVNQGVAPNTYPPPPPVRPYSASPQGPSAAKIPSSTYPHFTMQASLTRGPVDALSQSPAFRPRAAPLPGPSLNQPIFLEARSVAVGVPRVPFENSGDFGFQTQPQQNSAAPRNPWQGSTLQNNPPPSLSVEKPLDIRAPTFLPNFHNQPQRSFFRDSFRPHPGDRYDRFQPHFTEQNPSDVFLRSTLPPFSHGNFGMHNAPLSHVGEMNFRRYHQWENMHDSFPSRSGNEYLPHAHGRPVRNPSNNNPTGWPTYMRSRGQQAYDPFSPTTGATTHQQQQSRPLNQVKDQESNNNPDLMASANPK